MHFAILGGCIEQKKRAAISGALGETVNLPTKGIAGLKESPLIDIVLRRHPQETAVDRLRKEYIRTSKEITVEALKIFLGKKLDYSPFLHFQVRVIHYLLLYIQSDNMFMIPTLLITLQLLDFGNR
jgi:hypothetical protein